MRFILVAIMLTAIGQTTDRAFASSAKFCVRQVDTKIADQAEMPTARDRSFNIQVPGMPSPIYGDVGNAYSIGTDFALHAYMAPFPYGDPFGSFESWRSDLWNARILGIQASPPRTILEMKTGQQQFHIIYQDNIPIREMKSGLSGLHKFAWITADDRHQEIVFTDFLSGSYYLADDRLVPWPDKLSLFDHNIAGAESIGYDKILGITLIGDGNLSLSILTDDGQWYHLEGGTGGFGFDRIVHLPEVGMAALRDQRLIAIVQYNPGNKQSPYRSLIDERGKFSTFEWPHLSELFAQVLRYNTDFPMFHPGHWQVLTATGYEDIPGGKTGLDPGILAIPKDLSVIHKSLIEGKDRWYLYDGHTIVAIQGSSATIIGPNIYGPDFDGSEVYNLVSIAHVLVRRGNGVYEITKDGNMIRQPKLDGDWKFYDWPEAGVALAETAGGLVALDKNLNTLNDQPLDITSQETGPQQPLIWGEFLPAHGLVGRIGKHGIGVLIDTALVGPRGCP